MLSSNTSKEACASLRYADQVVDHYSPHRIAMFLRWLRRSFSSLHPPHSKLSPSRPNIRSSSILSLIAFQYVLRTPLLVLTTPSHPSRRYFVIYDNKFIAFASFCRIYPNNTNMRNDSRRATKYCRELTNPVLISRQRNASVVRLFVFTRTILGQILLVVKLCPTPEAIEILPPEVHSNAG